MFERTEELSVEISIPVQSLSDGQRIRIEGLLKQPLSKIINCKNVVWRQKISIGYSQIVNDIEFILSLIDISPDWSIKTKELKHARCLAQELLVKLEQLEGKFASK